MNVKHLNQFGERFFFTLAAAILFIPFAGCNREPSENSTDAAADQSAKLVVLTWEEYFAPEVIDQFTEDSGIEIEFVHFENLPDMKAMMQSRPDYYDVVVIDGASLAEAIELKQLQPLKKQKIPNFKNFDEKYLDRDFDPGNRYSTPYMWGSTLIAYRSDKLEDPEKSWNLLWDESLKGKIVMLEEMDDLYALTLLSLGEDLNEDRPEIIENCTEKLIQQVDELEVRYEDLMTARKLISSGESWVIVAYSGDAAIIAADDENISYFIPEEGASLWVDGFAVSREAKHPDAAHRFIDFMADAKVAAENSNYLWYATANRAALDFVNPELKADKSIYPAPEVLGRCDFIRKFSPDKLVLTNRGMKRILDQIGDRPGFQEMLIATETPTPPPAGNLTVVEEDQKEEREDKKEDQEDVETGD